MRILVQDPIGREITKVIFKNNQLDLKYGRRTFHESFFNDPNDQCNFISAEFDENNHIFRYRYHDDFFTPNEFKTRLFSDISEINEAFFTSIFPFVPEIDTTIFVPFIFKTKLKTQDDHYEPMMIKCVYDGESKLKFAIDYFRKWSFLKNDDEMRLELKELLFYNYHHFFYNLRKTEDVYQVIFYISGN